MPFRDKLTHLRDIVEGIDSIESFVGNMNLDAYRADPLRRSAVERQLQIITEAAKRLGEDAYALCPDEDWKGFCRMGDVLRHGYHRIDDEIVWDTVKDELPKMRAAALKAINSPLKPMRLEWAARHSQCLRRFVGLLQYFLFWKG